MNKKIDRSSKEECQSKATYVRQGFDQIALRYDCMNDLMTLGMHRRWKTEVIQKLHIQPGVRILDLCSGTGDLAYQAMRQLNQEGFFVALDFAPIMLDVGRKKQNRNPNLHWVQGDAQILPFSSHVFDAAMVGFGLRNVDSIEMTLSEVFRVLKPGAWFVSLDTAASEWRIFNPFYRFYMRYAIPLLGHWFAGDRDMYSYLNSSSETFLSPSELTTRMRQCGYHQTGYKYRPRLLGGAALVWGQRPVDRS